MCSARILSNSEWRPSDTPWLQAIGEKAKANAPGWDVYFIEQEWREWITEPPRNPDAAFLGFCKKWYEKRGPAR